MAASEQEAADSKPFRFEDLPAELQVRIIEFAVIEDEPINITRMGHWATGFKNRAARMRPSAHRTQPEISKVSKSIRADALKAYYKCNEFQANYCDSADYRVICRWLEAIGEKNRALITNLAIAELYELKDDLADGVCCFQNESKDTRLRNLGATLEGPEGKFGIVRVSFPTKKT